MLRGVDVSHYQGRVDWPLLVARHGISFAFAKACEGLRTVDARFAENWRAMRDAGIVRGVYYFGHPNQGPDAAASFFLDVARLSEPTDLLCLDLETSDGMSRREVNQWAHEFCATVHRLAPSYRCGIYAGSGYMSTSTCDGWNQAFGWWWYPRYPNSLAARAAWPAGFGPTLPTPNLWGRPPDFWQYTQTFPVGGTPYDADVFDGTLAELRALNGPQEDMMALTDAEQTELLTRIRQAEATVAALAKAEADRYVVYSNRHNHLASLLGPLADDEAKVAALLAGQARTIAQEVVAALPGGAIDVAALETALTNVLGRIRLGVEPPTP